MKKKKSSAIFEKPSSDLVDELITEMDSSVHLMVDFTVMQLKLCHDRLALHPELQEEIKTLITKLLKV